MNCTRFLILLSPILLLLLPFSGYTQHSDTTAQYIREVVISANGNPARTIEEVQMGKAEIPVQVLLKMPSIGGEKDVIKALQLTPGVKRGTEGGIGMYIRGGGHDENLILLDGAPVYNAGHLLGFFSVFNAAVVRDAQLYKSSFPARYGGRLSAVLDVRTKDGSFTEHHAEGAVGLISSSLACSGPVIRDKLSFSVAARRTYIDQVLRYVPYNFYDLNGKAAWTPDAQNRITFSFYKGDDVLRLKRALKDSTNGTSMALNTDMNLGNTTLSLHWLRTALHERLTMDINPYYTRFRYNIAGRLGAGTLDTRSSIRDLGMNVQFRYLTGKHRLDAGFSIINHLFNPNMIQANGKVEEEISSSEGRRIYNSEAGLWLNDEYPFSERLLFSGGLRISAAQIGSTTYLNPEPRLGARFKLNDYTSLKASYARMAQYMHLVSSSSVTLPTDLWYPATATVKPGISDQLSIGAYHILADAGINLTAEVYYKWLRNLVEYREGAQLVLNDHYEDELLHGQGRSYGLELMASKTSGRFTGWIAYSLSWAHRRFDSLNRGRDYYARYDRRHDLSVTGAYDINRQLTFSTAITYATGNPFTGQTGQYLAPDPGFTEIEVMPVYTMRNELRFSAAFRVDASLSWHFRITPKLRAEAAFSVYNVMNRTQPSRVERIYDEAKKEFRYQQKGLFGLIPAASINFKF